MDTTQNNQIKKAHRLGGIKAGQHHWWLQRVTAIALIPLTLWVVFSLASLIGQDYRTVKIWFTLPHHTVLSVLFIVTAAYHASLGLQVIVEDYIHHLGIKQAVLITLRFLLIMLGTLCTIVLLRLAFVH